jgi:hypothetical protein
MKRIRLTKKGSNVGVVLSFVIFIAFLFFVFTVLKPKLTFGENKQSTVDYLSTQLMNDFYSNLTTIYINVTSSGGTNKNCVELSSFISVMRSISNVSSNLSSRDGNTNANLLTRLVSGSDLDINRTSTSLKFFKVYYSPDLKDASGAKIDPGCWTRSYPSQYSISYIKVDVYAFESKINYTFFNYNLSYNNLKMKYKLPADTNFGFSFKNAEGIVKQSNYTVPKTTNVYSNEVPVLYVDNNATIKSGFLTVVLW